MRYAKRGLFRLGQERRPQLLCAQSLLLAESNGVDHSDSRLVYRAGQVVCRPENHSYTWLTATQKSSESWSLRDYERGAYLGYRKEARRSTWFSEPSNKELGMQKVSSACFEVYSCSCGKGGRRFDQMVASETNFGITMRHLSHSNNGWFAGFSDPGYHDWQVRNESGVYML